MRYRVIICGQNHELIDQVTLNNGQLLEKAQINTYTRVMLNDFTFQVLPFTADLLLSLALLRALRSATLLRASAY